MVFDDIFCEFIWQAKEYIETYLTKVKAILTITITVIIIITIADIVNIILIINIDLDQVCQIPLKHDRMDIEAHLKTAHKITCRLYEINFESGQVLIVLGDIFKII